MLLLLIVRHCFGVQIYSSNQRYRIFSAENCGSLTHLISEKVREKTSLFFFSSVFFDFWLIFFPREKFQLHSRTKDQRSKTKHIFEKKNIIFTQSLCCDFEKKKPGLQLLKILKSIRVLLCSDFFWIHIHLHQNYISYYYLTFKNKKSPTPTPDTKIKK